MAEKQSKSYVSKTELAVLRTLLHQRGDLATDRSLIDVNELASVTGIKDSDEILRALYTLEGKSLARPEPDGDLTSPHWIITDTGVKAVQYLEF